MNELTTYVFNYIFSLILIMLFITSLILILPIFIIIYIVGTIVSIPYIIGKQISMTNTILFTIDRFLGFEALYTVRDDLLMIIFTYFNSDEWDDLDPWSLERSIESKQEKVIQQLQSGEKLLAFFGGVLSVLIISSTRYVIILTIFLLVLSALVAFRIAMTKVIAFQFSDYHNASKEDLVMMKAFNSAPVGMKGLFAIVVVAILFKCFGDNGYNKGMYLISMYIAKISNSDFRKWHGS